MGYVETSDIVSTQEELWLVKTTVKGNQVHTLISPCLKDGRCLPADLARRAEEFSYFTDNVDEAFLRHKTIIEKLKVMDSKSIPKYLKSLLEEARGISNRYYNRPRRAKQPELTYQNPTKLYTVAFTETVQRTITIEVPAKSMDEAINTVEKDYSGQSVPDGWDICSPHIQVISVQDINDPSREDEEWER